MFKTSNLEQISNNEFITEKSYFIFMGSSRDELNSKTPSDIIENKDKKINQNEIIKNLNGRTLMVYFVLLNIKQTGVRELQRKLELSSPSVARYHLDKLVELNLVENRKGEYFLINKAKIPALTSWVLFGKQLIPRSIFAATFFTLLFIGYLIFIFTIFHKDSILMFITNIIVCIYLWFDVWWHYRNKPF